MRPFPIPPFAASLSLFFLLAAAAPAKTVKVFILAGQSNMEGKAKVSLMDDQASRPEMSSLFAHLRNADGTWKERDDVWIRFLDRKGRLTVGFGSPGRVGPELNFGHVVGDHFEEPVLLIKTAWGGKSLFRDFRPPSSGIPDEATLAGELEKANRSNRKKNRPEIGMDEIRKSYGHFYRLMLEEVKGTLAGLGKEFPELEGYDPEITGFVWFQGWNDMVNPEAVAVYAGHMANFIRDVRRDLGVPGMPFVIGQLGVAGTRPAKPNERRDRFKENQAAPAKLPEFRGNVAVVKTDQYWDETAQAVFDKGWKNHREEWERVGSDYPFHYLGSPRTFLGIGKGFGEAMLGLLE